jgi:hypothetical protein
MFHHLLCRPDRPLTSNHFHSRFRISSASLIREPSASQAWIAELMSPSVDSSLSFPLPFVPAFSFCNCSRSLATKSKGSSPSSNLRKQRRSNLKHQTTTWYTALRKQSNSLASYAFSTRVFMSFLWSASARSTNNDDTTGYNGQRAPVGAQSNTHAHTHTHAPTRKEWTSTLPRPRGLLASAEAQTYSSTPCRRRQHVAANSASESLCARLPQRGALSPRVPESTRAQL